MVVPMCVHNGDTTGIAILLSICRYALLRFDDTCYALALGVSLMRRTRDMGSPITTVNILRADRTIMDGRQTSYLVPVFFPLKVCLKNKAICS